MIQAPPHGSHMTQGRLPCLQGLQCPSVRLRTPDGILPPRHQVALVFPTGPIGMSLSRRNSSHFHTGQGRLTEDLQGLPRSQPPDNSFYHLGGPRTPSRTLLYEMGKREGTAKAALELWSPDFIPSVLPDGLHPRPHFRDQ